jgi:hypothetical protein
MDGFFMVFFRLPGRQEGPDGMAEVPCALTKQLRHFLRNKYYDL